MRLAPWLTQAVRSGAICTMSKPPTPETVRLTITVTPEVHAAFQRMAEVSGMSLGRCMGEWLGDTLEGVEFLTTQLQRAREAPRKVVQEMRQGLLGALDEADELLTDIRAGRKGLPAGQAAGRRAGAPAAQNPPRPVIRGGKSPTGNAKRNTSGGQSHG